MSEKKKLRKRKAKYNLSCGVIVFNINKKKPEYLLVKYPTYWGFVRGQVEPGETEEMTAFREALEEAGLNEMAFVPGFREVSTYFFKRGNQIIKKDDVYLLAKANTWNVKISHEHEDIKWCPYEKAISLDFGIFMSHNTPNLFPVAAGAAGHPHRRDACGPV